ncbi:MAG: class IV adenylate cyclase [Planctomycetota bacterium]|jgi:predicted adenylyl cyclase CyaB
MNANIEIKAKVRDLARLKELADGLSETPVQLITQEDIFFHTPKGRLKLRVFSPDHGELIYYERDDRFGPKQSNYSITKVGDPAGLKDLLASALGVQGVVSKKRHLYLVGQTRIHIDEVEGLGYFVELEVVLKPGQAVEEGTHIVEELMKKLAIHDKDLLDHAYVDMLVKGD